MIAPMRVGWEFWIDRGGTFTDVIGVAPDGTLHVRKVLSRRDRASGAGDPGLAVVRSLIAAARGAWARIAALKVGTTVATNALLERTGAEVLLVTTAGFADALAIGDQSRPDIFARHIVRPERLYGQVIEARERIDADGRVLTALDETALARDLERARRAGVRAVAIAFLHGWRHTVHERAAAALARDMGFEEVSVSHELAPLVRFVPRAETTVLNAYLAAHVRAYVADLERELGEVDSGARLELMQSHGGLTGARTFHAASSLLSGPAGGLIGARSVAARLGVTRLVSFDMGGTSTDVALIDGDLPRRHEQRIAGIRVQATLLDVHTIAAGGGSVLRLRDGRASVGPDSAGADPGPACYGRGGPATLTDAQLLLGRLRADTLPHLFGADGMQGIDAAAAAERFAQLLTALRTPPVEPSAAPLETDSRARGAGPESLAEAFLEVAVAAMANAIRRVSVRQGVDPGELALLAFGGAAGQYACQVARAAGIRHIIVHPLASVLSAYGVGVADRSALLRRSLRMPLGQAALREAAGALDALECEARAELGSASEPAGETRVTRLLELRAGDSEITLAVPFAPLEEVSRHFTELHRRRFAFDPVGVEIHIEALTVEVRRSTVDAARLSTARAEPAPTLPATARVWFGAWREVPLVASAQLTEPLTGPALIVEPHSTLVLEPGWTAHRLPTGEILVDARATPALACAGASASALAAPARIEIFNNLFMHIAEQMGEVLRQTAQSVNIKERLDYSCALFDACGGLVANAPHMPVHLGSMGASVRAVIDARGAAFRPGEAWLLNSPYHGGTHLPDMTVVTPVFLAGSRAPDFFVASRAHHADVGGTTPGSMPAFSRSIEDEGVLIENLLVVEDGRLREAEIVARLGASPHPARNPRQNLADLRAQLAANARGAVELERAVREQGLDAVRAGMRQVQANAAACVRLALERLTDGEFRYEMDGGQVIAVRIELDRRARRARVDFSGTSPQGEHNFNAPRAVCVAAVLYVFRTLVERPIPLNEGCLAPLEVLIPRGSMLDPCPPAAVAAGNVETSQVIVDALYGALGALAASQGTMNNLTFGDEHLQYYETIAGGSGAGPGFDGCDAVQTHMTNSRLTDPEILEGRFPVLVREFRIRRGSGGGGRYRGGDGLVRRLQFRARLSGALLANRRRIAPFGLAGGAAAAPGAARIERAHGGIEELGATARFLLEPGDELEILTPGGGGYGTPVS